MKQNKMLVLFAGLFFVFLFANSANSQIPPFVGKYEGTFIVKVPIIDTSIADGAWDMTIASDGAITGSSYLKTTGDKTPFKGKLDEKGRVTIFFGNKGAKIEGLLENLEKTLSGSLYIPCESDSKKICGEVEVRLKRRNLTNQWT